MKKREKILSFESLKDVISENEYSVIWRVKRLTEKYEIIKNKESIADHRHFAKILLLTIVIGIIAGFVCYLVNQSLINAFALFFVLSVFLLYLYLGVSLVLIMISLLCIIFSNIFKLKKFGIIFSSFFDRIINDKYRYKKESLMRELRRIENENNLLEIAQKINNKYKKMEKESQANYKEIFYRAVNYLEFVENH